MAAVAHPEISAQLSFATDVTSSVRTCTVISSVLFSGGGGGVSLKHREPHTQGAENGEGVKEILYPPYGK